MVDNSGQLFTIEGIAAALIMLASAYLVVNATSIYTPGDTHINDMQLEVLGSDALRMMNTPVNNSSESLLQSIIENNNAADADASFNTTFLDYVNNRTGSGTDNLHYTANVTYRNIGGNTVGSYQIASTPDRTLTAGDHPVRVTEWVIVKKTLPPGPYPPKYRAALVEVLLWRD
jgi:hypothetical protein